MMGIGYVNNLPVDVMRLNGVGTVIASDVENKDNGAFEDCTPFRDITGLWILNHKLNPFASKVK